MKEKNHGTVPLSSNLNLKTKLITVILKIWYENWHLQGVQELPTGSVKHVVTCKLVVDLLNPP